MVILILSNLGLHPALSQEFSKEDLHKSEKTNYVEGFGAEAK
jgi:hypothetical protein